MLNDKVVTLAATRAGKRGNLVSHYLWFWKRIFQTILLAFLTVSVLYLYFFTPDGLAGFDYQFITTRWRDPIWGLLWRTFDWLLVVLGTSYVADALEQWLFRTKRNQAFVKIAKIIVWLVSLSIVVVFAQLIFQ